MKNVIVVMSGCIFLAIFISSVGYFAPDASSEPPKLVPVIKMVFVKGGCFTMGNWFLTKDRLDAAIHDDYDALPHTTCVDDYYIGKFEVTYEEWLAIYMLFVYPKSKQEDLTPAQIKVLGKLVRDQFK